MELHDLCREKMCPDAKPRCSYTRMQEASACCSVQSRTDPFERAQRHECMHA